MIRQTPDFYGAPAARNRSRKSRYVSLAAAVALLMTDVVWNATASRRVWAPEETPVAFWTWHSQTPSQEAVTMAVDHTAARTLFIRAGQIDYKSGEVQRIRAVSGSFPQDIDVHLVYNATRSCLAVFEKIDPSTLAVAVARAYAEDLPRASGENVHLVGVQLDFDVPTRLLSRYTSVLRALRPLLPSNMKLSITGLSAWMDSSELNETLAAADFWIPQFYGATIPKRLDRAQPISSSRLVAAGVARARRMNRPFYAGLAAHGYAIQYGADGSLIALRGDLDPALVANNEDFELISRGPFEQTTGAPTPSEWRYVYRARVDTVVDGTAIRRGDSLMLDVPTAESLRATARAAREQGGDRLLGICLFRLPQQSDATTLSIGEMAAALADTQPASSFRIDVKVEQLDDKDLAGQRVSLTISNDGAARSRMDDGAMGLALTVPAGSVRAIRFRGFTSADFQCEAPATDSLGNQTTILQPSSLRRASVLIFRAKAWPPGASATATIEFSGAPPDTIRPTLAFTLDDGRALQQYWTLDLKTRTSYE
ncbi:MAG TPA: DUF3142 domain-containing protein [Blastocatellia bacterium]|nr:DUF3142 domain-containing protein [Blastocatellia bacterium]